MSKHLKGKIRLSFVNFRTGEPARALKPLKTKEF